LRNKIHSSPARSQRLINALVVELQKLKARRVTDREIAQWLKMRPGTLSKWRSGRTKLDQIEWLFRLLDALPEERWQPEIQTLVQKKQVSRRSQ
jgi:DNA-binding transcriptional regulator YiaG